MSVAGHCCGSIAPLVLSICVDDKPYALRVPVRYRHIVGLFPTRYQSRFGLIILQHAIDAR